MPILLSDHFTYKKLLRFTIPSVAMMIFTSVYSIVDGFFVSNFVGKQPFTAVNFIMPFLMMLGNIGLMFGTGGSALVAKKMGENKLEKANEIFSLLIYTSIACGILFMVFGLIFLRPVAVFLGAKGQLLEDCLLYGRINLAALPFYILQFEFQSFCVTAEKPKMGLYITAASGLTNIIMDALLVAVFPFGLAGAAVATGLSQLVGGVIPLVYFLCPNKSPLRIGRTRFDGKALLQTCSNGASELMSNIAMSLVGMLYNVQLLRYAGEDGVAAYGVLMYVNMIFLAAFIGYSMGAAPIISYHYGAANHSELQSLYKKSLFIIGISSVSMFLAAELFAKPLASLFVGYDPELLALSLHGFVIYSFSFLFSGIAIFGSSFFTALNNGLISALISFLRTLVFEMAAVLLLPLIWKADGIWFSTVLAEVMAALLTVIFFIRKRKYYHY